MSPFLIFGICLLHTPNIPLKNWENLLRSFDYQVRYEKGNFKTGACMLETSKIIVVNKFSNLENRINSLVELIRQMDLNADQLTDEKQKQFLYLLKQTTLNL